MRIEKVYLRGSESLLSVSFCGIGAPVLFCGIGAVQHGGARVSKARTGMQDCSKSERRQKGLLDGPDVRLNLTLM